MVDSQKVFHAGSIKMKTNIKKISRFFSW